MSRIRLTWDIGTFNPEKHYIYRSDSEISPDNLPSPIGEVGKGVNEYVDDDGIVEGETYHYFVAAEKKGLLVPADASIAVVTYPSIPDILGDSTEIAFYRFDGTLNDEYDKWNAFSAGTITYEDGVFNEAVNTDGGGIGISPNIFNDTDNEFTATFWVKAPPSNEELRIISKALTGAAINRFALWLRNGNTMRYHMSSTSVGTGTDFFANVSDYRYNKWNHFAITYDGSAFRIFIDSKLQATTARNILLANSYDLVIGGSASSSGRVDTSNGETLFDNMRIFGRALPQEDIETIFNLEGGKRV